MLIRPDHGSVHVMDFPIQLSASISLLLQLGQEPVSQSLFAPPVKARLPTNLKGHADAATGAWGTGDAKASDRGTSW